MDLRYPESAARFADEVRAFVRKELPQDIRDKVQRRQHVSVAEVKLWQSKLCARGWACPGWPKEYGGPGFDALERMIFDNVTNEEGAPTVVPFGEVMFAPVLFAVGTPAQKAHFLPRIRTLEHWFCQGFSEPGSGSDLASLRTRAVLEGDEWVINGQKMWTSGAHNANHIFMLVRTDPDAKLQEGISMLVFPMSTPGVTVRPIVTLPGELTFCQTFFDNVRVPSKNMVGLPNQGWTIAKGLLGFERLNSGSPRRSQYACIKAREVAQGRGLWEDAEYRAKFTKLEMDLYDLGIVFGQYADVISSGGNPGPAISLLKIWGSETNMRFIGLLMEAAGGAGMLAGVQEYGKSEADVHFSYCQLFPGVIASGTSDIQRNVLSKRVLGLN